MITFISKWKLKNGCPPELIKALEELTESTRHEPGVLVYLVNLQALFPIDSSGNPLCPPPPPIPLNNQTEIIFIESYSSVEAFSEHLKSPTLNNFLENNLRYFDEDPQNPGSPKTEIQFLDQRFSIVDYPETKA